MDHMSASTEAMYEAAPNVAGSVHAAMIRGVQFLDSKIPAPKTQFPLSPTWKPSQAQIAQFSRYYRAVNDPLSVMTEVKRGTLTHADLESLQVVHPQLLQQMQQSVIENLDPKTARTLPYQTQLSIAKFIGQPLDENMTTPAIQGYQAVYTQIAIEQARKDAAAMGGKPIKPTEKGLAKITLAERTSLQSSAKEN
jgi:hypothetical protein